MTTTTQQIPWPLCLCVGIAGGLVTWAVYPLDAEICGYAGLDLKWVRSMLALLVGNLSFAVSMAITRKASSGETSPGKTAPRPARYRKESTLWLIILALLSIRMILYHSSIDDRFRTYRVGLFAIAAGAGAARVLWWFIQMKYLQQPPHQKLSEVD